MAFVLSGGASLGAIQVGMLQALYERGIAPDLIVGSSVGASGVGWEQIVFDPSIDLAKTPAQSVEVLRRLGELHALGRPLLLAVSRKDFVGAFTGRPPRGGSPARSQRSEGRSMAARRSFACTTSRPHVTTRA